MSIDKKLLHDATIAFNSSRILKGQVASIATSDAEGRPNIAPIGSLRVVDENRLHVLQGFLPRTLSNLNHNPRAAFSVTIPPSLSSLAAMFRKGEEAPSGYRLYGELVEIIDDKAVVQAEARKIAARVPFILRKPFTRFCENNLKRLLKFQILDVRPA